MTRVLCVLGLDRFLVTIVHEMVYAAVVASTECFTIGVTIASWHVWMAILVTVVYVGPAVIFVVLAGTFDAVVIALAAYLLVFGGRNVPTAFCAIFAGRRALREDDVGSTDRGGKGEYSNCTAFELHLVLLGTNCSRFRPICRPIGSGGLDADSGCNCCGWNALVGDFLLCWCGIGCL